jgi:hypothetical protein
VPSSAGRSRRSRGATLPRNASRRRRAPLRRSGARRRQPSDCPGAARPGRDPAEGAAAEASGPRTSGAPGVAEGRVDAEVPSFFGPRRSEAMHPEGLQRRRGARPRAPCSARRAGGSRLQTGAGAGLSRTRVTPHWPSRRTSFEPRASRSAAAREAVEDERTRGAAPAPRRPRRARRRGRAPRAAGGLARARCRRGGGRPKPVDGHQA